MLSLQFVRILGPTLCVVLCCAAPLFSQQVAPPGTLTAPFGMLVDSQDRLWISEAGTGNMPGSPPSMTGQVSRFDPATGMMQPVLTGFASVTSPEGTSSGVHHLAWDPQNADRMIIAQGIPTGEVQTWDVNTATMIAGSNHAVAAYANSQGLPAGGPIIDSNVYSVASDGNGNTYAVDAGANAIIKINAAGVMSVFAQFPNLYSGPPGAPSPMNRHSVPTKILATSDGLWVCNLTGGPFWAGTASVFHVDFSGTITTVQTGFTALIDIAIDPTDGRVAALSFGTFDLTLTPPGFVPFSGTVTKLTSSGVHAVATGLMLPTGMAYTSNGDLYVHSFALGSIDRIPRAELSMSLSLNGAGDLDIGLENGVAGDPYFFFYSVDGANATFPGGGWLGGLHISLNDAIVQATVGLAGDPLFGGTFDANGSGAAQIINASVLGLPGVQAWGVGLTVTPGTTPSSNVASVILP